MTKHRFLISSVVVSALAICGAVALASLTKPVQTEKADADTYTMTLNSTNPLDIGSGAKVINNEAGWPITFQYGGVTGNSGCFASFTGYGNYIMNESPIHAMQSIKVTFTGEKFECLHGFGLTSDQGEQAVYNYDKITKLTSGVEHYFDSDLPSYFVLTPYSDTTITEIEIKYTCDNHDNRGDLSYYNLAYSNEEYAKKTPGYVRYWAAKAAWNLSEVTMNHGIVNDDSITIMYGVSVKDCSYGLQLFYVNPSLDGNKNYTLSFDINISVAKTIELNGESIALVAGDNEVSVKYTQVPNECSLKMVVPTAVSDGSNVTISITNLAWAEVTGEINFGGESAAVAEPDVYRVWNDQNWCGSTVTLDKAVINNDDSITLQYTSIGACTFGLQLFFKNSSLTNGETYTLTVAVDALVACDVCLQHDTAACKRSLVAGSNTISIEYTEAAASASFAFIVPVSGGSSNTFTITAVTWAQAI